MEMNNTNEQQHYWYTSNIDRDTKPTTSLRPLDFGIPERKHFRFLDKIPYCRRRYFNRQLQKMAKEADRTAICTASVTRFQQNLEECLRQIEEIRMQDSEVRQTLDDVRM